MFQTEPQLVSLEFIFNTNRMSCRAVATVTLEGEKTQLRSLSATNTSTLVDQVIELAKLTNDYLTSKIVEGKYINQSKRPISQILTIVTEAEVQAEDDEEEDEDVDDNNNNNNVDQSAGRSDDIKKQKIQ
jgi:hypothetical protein